MTAANIRRALAISVMSLGVGLMALPAAAQTGAVKGKVVDAQGNPVEGAKVAIVNQDVGGHNLEVKTNKKGEFMQIGLPPGRYKLTAAKDPLTASIDLNVHIGDPTEADIKLVPGGSAASGSKEDAAKANAKRAAMNQAFSEAVALTNDNKNDEAIAKFQEVIAGAPTCAECYANVGTLQAREKKWDEAEASYKKAIELKPDYANAYNGLAGVYNSEKKFDQAADASKKAMDLSAAAPAGAPGAPGAPGAAGGASAAAVFNQGVILWNAGKYPEAKAQFEQAVKLDPSMADAHYQLGMALLNGGDTAKAKPEFETYLKLAPTGPNAATAKSIIDSIK